MDAEKWWSTWAPVWDHIEDRHFGTTTTESLMEHIKPDVLVVGAGQGLIVRHLMNKGISATGLDINPNMVKVAKEKYNLDIVEGDAGKLPFSDDSYSTVIISSGVVDYGADEAAIATFINEAKRVCRRGGKVLVAFYKIKERIERIYRKIGVIDSDSNYRMRRIFEINEIAEKFPPLCAIPIQKWTGKSMARVNFEWLIVGLTQPKEFRTERKWINALFKNAKEKGLDKKVMIDSVPGSIPYRDTAQVKELMDKIREGYSEIQKYDDSSVVIIEK
ncbi:MAG TPA: class I SAM-dependent methyltransferase [Spirochaetota bacterium]|nr:class I SAM-dependent methyltransferase [Spirochaetota bacterium]HPC40101.1 class I SAM-dependent methyltransferase [Spirochaetota bacterium]HPL15851.1 class I SAM-dependent methyltransferase [Spirochaetota bacterium]HQF08505.1 class I SAM-dependent methyltransferase [Spirochaetota bacterium]HQH97258.1 class I SAM-dependent methyltransferase [Spirochaetota bacterium]